MGVDVEDKSRRATQRRRRATAALTFAGALWCLSAAVARAQLAELPVHLRTTLAGAAMISEDQVGRLGYDSFGIVGDLQLGYALTRWLDVRVGVGAGAFVSELRTGGLLEPLLGAALAWPGESFRPWLQVDCGLGFTGALLRPMVRTSIGADFWISKAVTLGPALGYSHLFQHDAPGSSTDARYIWFGVVLGLRPPGKRREIDRVRWVTKQRTIERTTITTLRNDRDAPAPAQPGPSPTLLALLDDALPTQRSEWLAPVLFALDSSELEPQGVAMLHEVARELAQRPELKRLEIRAYADSRGTVDYNLKLSEQRASRVLEWLVAHGIERERLRIAPHGATDFVEPGSSEPEHEQNRRVVFRTMDPAE